ncbi:hypothetical protein ACF08W_31350 [Streptomyces sp. NPDC015144]
MPCTNGSRVSNYYATYSRAFGDRRGVYAACPSGWSIVQPVLDNVGFSV